jgi:hypothetical protein
VGKTAEAVGYEAAKSLSKTAKSLVSSLGSRLSILARMRKRRSESVGGIRRVLGGVISVCMVWYRIGEKKKPRLGGCDTSTSTIPRGRCLPNRVIKTRNV